MTKGTWITYSAEELAWIKAHRVWPRAKAHAKFIKKFGRPEVTADNIKSLCSRKKWKTGRDGRIPKGNVPVNKGKKCAPGVGANHPNAVRTRFKKGGLPANTKYLGHERINVDGYVEISIAEKNPHTGFGRRYVHKHRYLWEQKNGAIPEGHFLKCLDGNRQNTDLSNWKCMPRSAQPFLNGHRGYDYEAMPEELKPAVLALAEVKAAKGKIVKKTKDEARS